MHETIDIVQQASSHHDTGHLIHLAQEYIWSALQFGICIAGFTAAKRSPQMRNYLLWFAITGGFMFLMHGLHAVFSMSHATGAAATFIPLTWLASAIIDPIMLFFASKDLKKKIGVITMLIVAPITFIGLYNSNVTAYYDWNFFGLTIGRPQEFVPLALISIGLLIEMRNRKKRFYVNPKNTAILNTYRLGFLTCAVMLFSTSLFDTAFVVAHGIGIISSLPLFYYLVHKDPKLYRESQQEFINKLRSN